MKERDLTSYSPDPLYLRALAWMLTAILTIAAPALRLIAWLAGRTLRRAVDRERIRVTLIGLLFLALGASLLVWATDPRTDFHMHKGEVQR